MKKNLSIAIQASIAAGIEILKIYATDFESVLKSDNSPLTVADQKADEVINNYLTETGIPIISEENKQIDYSERKNWNICWMVDPLDGTKEFIKRNGEFTVNIALIVDGNPVLGVIYVPVSKTLYFTAADGKSSHKLVLENEITATEEIYKKAIAINPASKNAIPFKIVGSRSHRNEATEEFIQNLQKDREVELVSKGSSLKFCLVAEGAAHIYPRFAPTMEWDTAAGQAICQAVGVSVINMETKEPLRYNKEDLLNNYFLVGSFI